jgi:hypothetical protein
MKFKGYNFRENYNMPVAADVIGHELERIRTEHGGDHSAAEVKEAARPEHAPLHPCVFDCEPAAAAEHYYTERARTVIRSVVPVYEEDDGRVVRPLVHNVHVTRPDGKETYLPLAVAVVHEDYREQVRRDALSGLDAWRARFGAIADFRPIADAIGDFLDTERRKADAPKAKAKAKPRRRPPEHRARA